MQRSLLRMTNDYTAPVKIKLITTVHPTEGESETYEMWLRGNYIEKAGSTYLRYEEIQQDQAIRTTIKLGQQQALILRNGAINMRLPLHSYKQQIGHYDSELGLLPLVIDTQKIDFQPKLPNEKTGTFTAQYHLKMNGQTVGNYIVDIQFTEVQS